MLADTGTYKSKKQQNLVLMEFLLIQEYAIGKKNTIIHKIFETNSNFHAK